jgi:hypothetical protein
VPDQSYLSVWCADFPEDRILDRFGAFLSTVSFSARRPGFTHLTVRAVDASESPVYEQDLRSTPLDAASVVEEVREFVHSDCSFEVRAYWDLATFDSAKAKLGTEPQPLEISCFGEDYDDGVWRTNGHFQVNLGFEHFFTGQAGLLGIRRDQPAAAESEEEARFLETMAWPENLERYQKETRSNIARVFDWVRRIQKDVPIARVQLWSEGEENFEARLEEILAVQ